MKDANESYLDQHQSELAKSDNAQDWKDDYIDELTREGGEYYPFDPDNFKEAIAELDLGQSILVATYGHVASKMPSQSSNTNFAEYMIRVAREYWNSAAAKKADSNYYTYYQDKRSCQE